MGKVIPSLKLPFCVAKHLKLALPLAWAGGPTCFTPQSFWPQLKSVRSVCWRAELTHRRASQEEGSRADFGEQLPAMLKTSGNWLRSCGENRAAFLRPISLERPVGNRGRGYEKRTAGAPPLSLPRAATPAFSYHPLLAGISLRLCFLVCCCLCSGGTRISEFFSPSASVPPLNHTLLVWFTTGLFIINLPHVSSWLLILCTRERFRNVKFLWLT